MTDSNVDYTQIARHFDVDKLPSILEKNLPDSPFSFADYGCGDGPFFQILFRKGYIGKEKPIYAVDLQPERLHRVTARYNNVIPINSSVLTVNKIPDGELELVISTMVLEHIDNEKIFLDEIYRVLKEGGRAFLTTIYKKPWAWYFRKRNGQSVLDITHIREYTDIDYFRRVVTQDDKFTILDLDLQMLFFPLLDPLLFRLIRKNNSKLSIWIIRTLRFIRIPILGYYTLSVLIQK